MEFEKNYEDADDLLKATDNLAVIICLHVFLLFGFTKTCFSLNKFNSIYKTNIVLRKQDTAIK